MFPVGSTAVRLGVAGGVDDVAECFSGWEDETGQSVECLSVHPEQIASGPVSDRRVDCLVIDAETSGVESTAAIEQWTDQRPNRPVVLLVDGWDDTQVADALSAGATEILPKELVDNDPDLFADEVVSAVNEEHAWTSFRELYDSVAGIAMLHDPDSGALIHANRALCDLLGYDRDDVVSMRVGDFTADVPGYDHERAMNVVSSVTDRDDPIEVEWPVTTAEGAVRWIETRLQTVRIGGRELVLWSSVDVTERRRHEREYEQVFDNVNDIISIHDPWEEEMVEVNETMAELTGYSREALTEMDIGGFSVGEEGFTEEKGYEIQQRVAATGEPETVEWMIETASGDERLLESNLAPATIAGEDRVLALSRDVTERRELERTYRSVFDNVSDGLVLHDAETGEIVDVNDRFCEMHGYDRDELVGETIDTVTGPDRTYEEAQERIEATRAGDPQLFEWQNQRRGGDTFPVEVHLSTADVRGEERILASVRDITERKRRKREFEQIFDSVNDAIAVHDPETGDLVDVNETYVEQFGYDAETIRELGVEGLSVSDEGFTKERGDEIIGRVAETGTPETVEWKVERADGEVRVYEVNATAATIGGEDRVLTINRDITERKRREREYEQIFNGVHDAITIHDPETAELLDVNDTFCEILGYDRQEILEMGVVGYSPTDSDFTMDQARAFVRDVVETGEPKQTEWAVETRDGDIRWLDVKGTTVEIGGELRYVSIDRDVTEQKRREREYQQIFDGVNEAIVVQDPDTAEPLDANQTLLDRLGYDGVDEVRRAGFDGLTASEAGFTKQRAREICRRVMETGEPETVEWQQETRDGERRWIEATVDAAEIHGEDRILSMQRDITDRKRRERMIRALHESTDQLQEAETAEAVCEAAVDAATEVLDLWLPTCWLHEDGESSVLAPVASGDDVQDLPLDARPRELESGDFEYGVYERETSGVYDPETLDGGSPPGDAVLVSIDGHGLLGAVNRRDDEFDDVIVDAAEILARHVRSALDRVERARELRESERRFRLIAEHIDEIVYVSTADFSEILYINPSYEDIYGRSVSELAEDPTSFVDASHPDDRDRYEADVRRLINDVQAGTLQEAYEGEYRIERDGETRWVSVTRFPVTNEDGAVDRIVGRVQDVTERKRREREYEQIFNGVSDAITVNDPETGEIIDVNETMCELLGHDREEILGRNIPGISVVEDGYTMDEARELVREVVSSGETETFEWKVETADGEHRWLEVTGTPAEIRGETRYLSITRDVTERKRREREYEQIFNGVTDAITVHDPQTGDLVDLNETMCDLTGYDREELLAEGQAAINVGEEGYSTERAREIVRDVMASGEKRTFEWLIERADGRRRWLEINATPTTLNGESRYLAIMRDVTEQRHTERRLREILERIDESIYLTRAAELSNPTLGDEDLYAGYESIWGEPLERIFERYDNGFFDTLHPEEESEFREFIADIGEDLEAGTTDERYTREYRIVRPDGETRWARSDFYTIEWPTGPLRVAILSRDITDRKAREQRMASFDDATDDLATADTPEEATRTAVHAATEALELPAVGVFLYDGDDGVLRPEALAGPLPSEIATDPVGPGDGPLWNGFATGTIVASDGGHSESGFLGDENESPTALADLAEWRALALGNHGILLVGSPESSLGSETIQAAHVLAATLEAALNHLEGQQRLATREEQLRTQTERAERLDRIARLTQRVEAAITDASDPGEIERAVCERLASSGPYDLAWLGGLEAGSDRLSPRAVVGSADQYVEKLNLSTAGDTADPHPAVAAWESDEVRVADSLVGAGPADDWRRHGLSEGYQSLCAVPLTYDGVTHGVLTVGTDSPNAFGDRERDVLAQLGTSIANAIAAVERRRALESDETVELEFRGPGEALSVARAANEADCRVRHERTVARQDGSVSVYFSFEDGVPDDAPAVADRTLPGSVEVVNEQADSVLVESRTDDWFGAPMAEYGGVLRETAAEPGETTVTVEVPQQADVRSFVERLRDIAPSLDLVARRQHRRRERSPAELSDWLQSELTDRQFEVLRTALSEGYFEWPREHDGSEVADRLDITQPTFNKHLRIAERKTFGLLFDDDT